MIGYAMIDELENTIQRALIDFVHATGRRIEHVRVDTRKYENYAVEVFLEDEGGRIQAFISAPPDLLEAVMTCQSWIDLWTQHVGNCKGGTACTCGRTAVLFEASAAISKAAGQGSGA